MVTDAAELRSWRSSGREVGARRRTGDSREGVATGVAREKT